MLARLFLLFTVVPLVELYLLLWLASFIGFWPTLAIVLTTAALGAFFAKREGLKVLRGWQRAVAEMRVPEEGLTGGLLVLVGGVLLITPGVITDVTGLLLLVPPVRRRVARWIERRFFPGGVVSSSTFAQAVSGPGGRRQVRIESFRVGTAAPSAPPARVEVIDHGPSAAKEPEVLEADVVVDRRGRVVHRS
jgi:UPF0716 protein FxsA